MQTIQLDAVLGYIRPSTRMERSDMDLIFYASQAFKSLDLSQDKEKVCVLLPIYKKKAQMPDDVLYITKFEYIEELNSDFPCQTNVTCPCGANLCDNVTEDNECESCKCPVEPLGYSTHTNNICKYNFQYQLWIDMVNKCTPPTKLEYKGRQRSFISHECMDTCTYGWSLNQNTIGIDFEEGWIHMIYEAYIKDDNGKYLIPNNTDLLRGLALYAEAMCEFDKDEQNSFSKYQTLLTQAEVILKKYSGGVLLRGIDFDKMNSIIGTSTNAFDVVKWRRG